MSADFPVYHKINSIMRRHTEGPQKGRFVEGQWAQDEFLYLQDNEWVWREKIDGTNIRIKFQTSDVGDGRAVPTIGGRSDSAQIPATLISALQDYFVQWNEAAAIENVFEGDDLARGEVILYGEGYGAGIQKGGAYGDPDFILFDVRIGGTWMVERVVTQIAESLGLRRVPLVGIGTLREAIDLVSNHELKSQWDDVTPEGLVVTPLLPLFDRRGQRIITKIKGVDFK